MIERFRVELLGPVRAWNVDQLLNLGPPMQQAAFVLLVLRHGKVVARDQLVDGLWGDDPPASAANAVHRYILGLRRLIEPGRQRGSPATVLTFTSAGYQLPMPPGCTDLERFDDQVASAQRCRAAGDLAVAAQHFAAAEASWRGPALSGIPGPFAEVERIRLNERRTAISEQRLDVTLARGHYTEAAAELAPLVAQEPLRERLRELLMLALCGCGRQAEALGLYQDTRRLLVRELGIEPGPGLQRCHQQILNGSLPAPAGAAGSPAAVATSGSGGAARGSGEAPNPRSRHLSLLHRSQLPPDIADFTGRANEVSRLCLRLAPEPWSADGPVPIAAVEGMPGVGKTALALHAAHLLRRRFPDGQLFVDLRGATPTPLDPAHALERFLSFLPGGPAPRGCLDELGERYRACLASKQVLVVLDDAAGEWQVRPLLPGLPGCAMLVTSQARLTGLGGADRIGLERLDTGEAVRLLAHVAGPERVAAEPAAAAAIVQRCDSLPLALRVVGAKLAARPHRSLQWQAERLDDEDGRLDELVYADLDVRASIARGCHRLGAEAQHTFRTLGLLDQPAFTLPVAAAALQVSAARAEVLLDRLVDARLLEARLAPPPHELSYRLHNLLRIYARELAVVSRH